MARTRRGLVTLLLAALLCGIAFAAAGETGRPSVSVSPVSKVRPMLATTRPRAPDPLEGFDPLSNREQGEGLVSDLSSGAVAELTLDKGLQGHVRKMFASYAVPYGALVALDPKTGRTLAYVSHSSANPDAGDLARDPSPPAASVFKVITGAALVDAGITPAQRVCYGGGFSRLSQADLEDNPARDRQCASLAEAMGGSINTVFAKLADRTLDAQRIERYAEAFGFGHALPFDAPTRVSPVEVPSERLELARTAAGFWHMHMSPLHAALIAATVANGGSMPRPAMVQRVVDGKGNVLKTLEPKAFRQVISRATANALTTMMERTVADGTARSAFHDERGRPYLPGISVAGKTGSLSSERPYRAYSWWVGFAPADKPEIAVAALIVNTPKWRIKASYAAREALRYYLVERRASQSHKP